MINNSRSAQWGQSFFHVNRATAAKRSPKTTNGGKLRLSGGRWSCSHSMVGETSGLAEQTFAPLTVERVALL